MKKILIVCYICCSAFISKSGTGDGKNFPSLLSNGTESAVINGVVDSIYHSLQLDSIGLQRDIFFEAYKGYEYLLSKGKLQNPDILTICDYSQSSHNKRLYVLDLAAGKVLFNTYVSHGKKSGGEFANSFSNVTNSNKSSLGFLVTGETYRGKAGYSMHFDGMENGINDRVRKRDIVMHGSWYVNAQRADEGEMMGRSLGCPALPYSEHKQIIDKIKNGTCFFAYHPDAWYTHSSQILNASFNWPVLADIAANQSPTTATQPAATSVGNTAENHKSISSL